MVTLTTAGVKISVETFYQPTHSNPGQSHYVFAYRITIINESNDDIRLKRRHWHILDSDNSRRELEGEGVVGEQPLIAKGETYQYVSGCNLNTEIGKMYGTYLMERTNDKKMFFVKIPEFNMVVPNKLN
ncbi:MAG: Co2+/Mg2+ efflux protein ApaG [Bacteroidia bacterium]|nr:Co2+/Mg2+ efflux protein ApaG [Bacteroidia bacterium]MCZ2277141.1 Co2+/Mg2+ efflux protein ApaG [Bacteroidia bacterium]